MSDRIASVEAALRLLEGFLEWPQVSQGVSELSRRLRMSKNRTYRILHTLEACGYLRKDPDTQAYQVGVTLLRLAHHIPRHFEMFSFVSSHLKTLAQQSQEVTHLIMRRGDHAACVEHRECGRMLRVSHGVDELLPLHVGGGPKLLLAFAGEEERERLLRNIELRRFTPHTISTMGELRKRLAEIRQSGLSVDEEEFEVGVCAVGAPVFNNRGAIVAGISLTVPKSRFGPRERSRLVRLVTATASDVSRELGYEGTTTRTDGRREVPSGLAKRGRRRLSSKAASS